MPKLFLAEEPCRHIIELLFFASVGDVARMRDLCQRHNIDVRLPHPLLQLEESCGTVQYSALQCSAVDKACDYCFFPLRRCQMRTPATTTGAHHCEPLAPGCALDSWGSLA